MDRHHFFVFYSSKATYVLNHRNTFVSVYLTSLMLIFIPLLLSTNVDGSSSLVQFLQNGAFAYLMMLIITAIPVLAWFFWESKYKEYRWNYMEVAIRCICEEKIFRGLRLTQPSSWLLTLSCLPSLSGRDFLPAPPDFPGLFRIFSRATALQPAL